MRKLLHWRTSWRHQRAVPHHHLSDICTAHSVHSRTLFSGFNTHCTSTDIEGESKILAPLLFCEELNNLGIVFNFHLNLLIMISFKSWTMFWNMMIYKLRFSFSKKKFKNVDFSYRDDVQRWCSGCVPIQTAPDSLFLKPEHLLFQFNHQLKSFLFINFFNLINNPSLNVLIPNGLLFPIHAHYTAYGHGDLVHPT